jgi:hypothetical protein
MLSVSNWLVRQFKALLLFPDYLREIAKQWMNILFGETLLGVAFIIWWALGNPPLVLIFISGALLAAYYAWRASYARFIPGLRIEKFIVHQTPTDHANVKRSYIQILPECLSDAPIAECRGYLLRVWKRKNLASKWEGTPLNQPLELFWSYAGTPVVTLQPGIGQRLNVAWIDNVMPRLTPDVVNIPQSAYSVFSSPDVFKFDIQVTGKDCAPVYIELEVENGTKWDELLVKQLG